MKYNTLGRTSLKVSEISLGCWSIGGPSWYGTDPTGWPDSDEAVAEAAIAAALDGGINHFDTADCYGDGESERRLGRIFRKLGGATRDAIVATKVGYIKGSAAHPYEPFNIRRQCEQSLINLQRDVLDVFYFHHADFGPDDALLDDAIDVAGALMREGKVRYVGLSAYDPRAFERIVPRLKPAVLQSWGNLCDSTFIAPSSKTVDLLEATGAGFVAFSPLAHGLLLDKYHEDAMPVFAAGDHRAANENFAPESVRKIRLALEKVRERFGGGAATLSAVAQRFVLAHPTVTCTITGFRDAEQVRINLGAAAFCLDDADIGLLREWFHDVAFS